MAALHDEGNDGGPQVVGGDSTMDFVGEKCWLHLHELLEQKIVKLGDVTDKVHRGHHRNIESVETDDGETFDNVAQLLHGLLVYIPLVYAVFANEEKLAERSQELLRKSLQLGPSLLASCQSGGDQELPGGDDLQSTLQAATYQQ